MGVDSPKSLTPSLLPQPSDWYLVTKAEVEKLGGRPLFQTHASLEALLRNVFPEHRWQSESFLKPSGYWLDPIKQREFLDAIGKELGVTQVLSLSLSLSLLPSPSLHSY